MTVVELPSALRFIMREAEQGDVGYILRTWKQNLAHEMAAGIHPATAAANAVRAALALLNARLDRLYESSRAIVACGEDDNTLILAFAVLGESCVHYVYTAPNYRNQGVARVLLAPIARAPINATCWTPAAEAYDNAHAGQITYRPSLAKEQLRKWIQS